MARPVITVTLNPAVDETITLAALTPGRVHRAQHVSFHAGGKGVNVASCLADWGAPDVTITGFLGAENARIFEALCAEKGILDAMVRIPGATRTNIKLAHDGETTDINTPGLAPAAAALAALREKLAGLVVRDAVVLLAGSLPPHVPEHFYAATNAVLRPLGARVILDASGAPLAAALRAAAPPFCVKPNRAELEEFVGRTLNTRDDVVGAAVRLRDQGIGLVAVSLGAEGAIFVGEGILQARLPAMRVASTVGAGDALVAGIIAALADDADLETTARRATAFAAGKLSCAGPNLPPRESILALAGKVEITKLEESTS